MDDFEKKKENNNNNNEQQQQKKTAYLDTRTRMLMEADSEI